MHDVERELKDLGERAGHEATYRSVPARRIVRRARLRRSIAVVLPTAAAVVLAAVVYPTLADLRRGSGGEPADLAAVARATEAAETARVELNMTMQMGGETATTRGTGEIDFERGRAYLRMDTTGRAGSEVFELITVGDTQYQRREGSKWSRYETGGGGFGAPGTGPADFLGYLEKISDKVTNLGNDELDGVEVTHYRATIDETAPGFGEMSESLEMELDPMDVWVDALGRLRQLTFAYRADTATMGSASVEMTMQLWDFGVPVDIAAPDPTDVTDEPLLSGEDGAGSIGAVESSGDAQFVFGESGMSEPFLTATLDDSGTYLVCVQALPSRAIGATVLHDPTGDVVLDFAPHRGGGRATGGPRCAPGVAHEAGDALLAQPSDYTLRVATKRGGLVVPLSTTGRPMVDE